MIRVSLLITGAKNLFVSQEVFEFVKSFETKDRDGNSINKAIYKLQHLAKSGFIVDGETIKHEQSQIFRIRIMNTGRMIGFYEGNKFIALSFFLKKSQKLNKKQKGIIKKVEKIMKRKEWMYEIS